MFNNKKNDPLIDSVKAVMEQNELFRQIEQELLEEYGVVSRKALPHEIQPEFDAVLAEAKKCAMEELKGDQHKIDANKNKKIDAHDFKLLRAKKKMGLEEETPADEGRRAAGYKGKTPGEQGEIAAKNDDEMRAKLKKGAVVGVPHVVRKVEGDDITIQKMHGKAAYPKVVSMSKITKVTGETVPVEESEQLDEERKRTTKVADAFMKGMKAKEKTLSTDGKTMTFHGNTIAKHEGDEVHVTTAGYGHSPSTRGHVNGILSRLGAPRLSQSKGKLMHGDKEVGSKDWIKVKKPVQTEESEQLDEKAVSKAQHRFFGLVRGIQKGKAKGSEKAEKAAKEMTVKQVRDFAKTKEKGLPEKVDEDIDSIMEEIRNNLEEQLIAVYESGDEDAFTDFIESLTEEQAEILGLNEQVVPGRGLPASAMTTYGQKAKEKIASVDRPAPKPATQPVRSNVAQSGGTGAAPSAVGVPPLSNQRPTKTEPARTAPATPPTPAKVMPKAKPMAPARPASGARPPSVQRPRPAGGAAAAQKRVGYSTTRAGASAGETMMANLMREDSDKPQIKESFEHFIRNKFLKD